MATPKPPAKSSKVLLPLFFGLFTLSCCCCLIPRCSGSSVPTLTADPNRKDGTAVYLLLDVSASMDDSVPNAQGKKEPKLDIAKRAAIDVCAAIAKYADEDAKRTIQIGVGSFSEDFRNEFGPRAPDLPLLIKAITPLETRGGTAIGDAVEQAQKALDATHLKNQHILIVTDGESNSGTTPEDIANAISKLPPNLQPSVYIIAFDVNASTFDLVKSKGWQVFSASDATQLKQQLDEVVGGHILIEK